MALALLAGPLAVWSPPAVAAETPRSVLVLYSYSRLLPGNIEFENGVRKSLPAVEIFDEFLDVPRFQGPAYLRTVRTYLSGKYAERRPDVVIAAGGEALRFLVESRDELFPGAPIVHAAIEREELLSTPVLSSLPADVIGVPADYDFAGTIEQALRLHPRARRLVIVTGQAAKDRQWEARLRQEVRAFERRVTVEFLAALPTRKVLDRLGELGTGSVVFTPGYFQDGDGRIFTPREATEAMAAVSTAPVYTVFTTMLGSGIVGGRMPDFENFGSEAGREAAALLAGVPPSAVPLPTTLPQALHLDWRQVRRWNISRAAIPADAVIHFREPTLFETYRLQVLLIASALAFQAALIGLLLVERRRRRAAELVAQSRRLELAHASRLAVAGELLGSIAHEIHQPLGAILANADAADLILLSGGDRRTELAAILTDIRRDDLRASEVIRKLRALLAGHEVERLPLEVNDAVREVEALLRPEARRRRVTLEVRPAAASGAPATILGDRIQLQQVLLNLALNAMDAVADLPEERRVVTIAVRTGAGGIEIEVRDRGQGIAPEDLPRLFDSFFTTKRQGMGLGLSIARTLIEAHGGRIRAENGSGEGAIFRIDLPAAPAITSPQPSTPQPSQPSQPSPPAKAPGTP